MFNNVVFDKLVTGYARRRFICLFISLLITLVAAPVLGALGLNTKLLEAILVLNFLAAIFISRSKLWTQIGLVLLALAIVSRSAYALLDYEPLLTTGQGLGETICLVSTCIMLRFIMSEGPVDSERIFAALNVYLLFGIMCGMLYNIFEKLWPGSFFYQGASFSAGRNDILPDMIYFSFVTLGTLGYGDMIPVSGPTRALAVCEAIGGQMYLVVVVARLVSLYKSRSERKDCNGPIETVRADNGPLV